MCGLVGFIPKLNKKGDLSKILPLFMLNEERGTHSSGISIGLEKYVGINENSKARNLITNSIKDLNKAKLLNKIILCHTRHATNGTYIEKNAHPFVWKFSKSEQTFVFMHNGVIRNGDEILKLCNINKDLYKDELLIDSHYLMACVIKVMQNKIPAKTLLSKYEGNAAFICYDNNNNVLVWKGANNDTEERPLYYVETTSGWYFCSIKESLLTVFPKNDIIMVPNNGLLKFENGELISTTIIKRSIIVPKTESVRAYQDSTLWDDYEPYNKTTSSTKIIDKLKINIKDFINFCITGKKETKKLLQNFPEYPTISVNHMSLFIYGESKLKYLHKNTYKPLNGAYILQKEGNIIYNNYEESNKNKKFTYFKNGVMIKNFKLYDELIKTINDALSYKYSLDDIISYFSDDISEVIVDFLPIYNSVSNKLIGVIYKNLQSNLESIYLDHDGKDEGVFNTILNDTYKIKKHNDQILVYEQ